MRMKKGLQNAFVSMIFRIIRLVFSLYISRELLRYYGSNINGLVSSIRQIIGYLSLLEVGISGASIYMLYTPLAQKDDYMASLILSDTKRQYFKSGLASLILAIIIGGVFAIFKHSSEVDGILIFLVFISLSVNIVADFFIFAKYTALFSADQREYIKTMGSMITLIISSFLILLLIYLKVNVVVMQFVSITSYFVSAFYMYFQYKKIYGNRFRFDHPKGLVQVGQKKDVFIFEIAQVCMLSFPIIAITVLYDFKSVSVYSVYNMVIFNIFSMISIFNTSFTGGFGEILAQKNYDLFSKSYKKFEFFYYNISFGAFSLTFTLIQPFINIYVKGINDFSYNDKLLFSFMIAAQLLNCLKTPLDIIVSTTGTYKRAMKSSLMCIAISIGGCLIGAVFSFQYALIGSILAYVVRFITFVFQAHSLNIKYSLKSTMQTVLSCFISFLVSIVLSGNLVKSISIQNPLHDFFAYAITAMIVNIGVFFTVSLLLNSELLRDTLKILETLKKKG